MPKSIPLDPEFRFLIELEPAFEPWRQLAAEWWAQQTSDRESKHAALSTFFVRYLHELGLDTSPKALFRRDARLPDLLAVLESGHTSERQIAKQHDIISNFVDWVLRTHLADLDEEGHRVVPAHLRHPFPRLRSRVVNKKSDLTFSHVRTLDPKMGDWCDLAAEWMQAQKVGVSMRRQAIDKLLDLYIRQRNLPRNPTQFLKRDVDLPDYVSVYLEGKGKGSTTLARLDTTLVNYASAFIDWVLTQKLGIEDNRGHRRVPPELHNPIPRLNYKGMTTENETVRSPLSIRYIEELRRLLCEGPTFRDWTWAQQAIDGGHRGGDWFVVDSSVVNPDDPDCVWRKREATTREREEKGLPEVITELWSPVRAVALYLKLELPLRTFQVRMLDSGEADTWRYEHGPQGGILVRNVSPLAQGSDVRPYQRGVFHRTQGEAGAGLYINTNKTADINRDENDKGYVIPWAHEAALYWLEKLRNWQERYNPITEPTPWVSLDLKHFGRTRPIPRSWRHAGRPVSYSAIQRAKGMTGKSLLRTTWNECGTSCSPASDSAAWIEAKRWTTARRSGSSIRNRTTIPSTPFTPCAYR
ncbi:MAG: integrase family protein [Thermaerobacter sp.]|nr:integrase family protein [Thermaerobacter sp.]